MKTKMLLLGFAILVVAIVVSVIVLQRHTQKMKPEIIVVAGKKIQLTPGKKFAAEIDGKKQTMWIQRYEPLYDENQPYLKSINGANWSTPEASRFSEISATTVGWLKKCYTSESWARRTKASIEKQLAYNRSRGNPKEETHNRFYYKVELEWNSRNYELLFFGIEDDKQGEPMHKEGVMWYFAYVKELDGWRRDTFLDGWSDKNPLFDYFDEHLDKLDELSQR